MKILHFSDTHLGFAELDKVAPSGINQREQDFYDAFKFVVDQALEIKPDLIIHSGDFFHRPSPPNRPMIFALQQLKRVSEAGIPFVVIAGNHETPKTIYTSPILEAFQTVDGIYPIFDQRYEYFEFQNLAIHGVPHINDAALQLEELEKIKPIQGKNNIIMLHTSIGKRFLMDEYGEQLFPDGFQEKLDQFDFVALGHWHNQQQVSVLKNAWYSGSIERLSDTEAENAKGFFLIDTNNIDQPDFLEVPARAWMKFEVKNCDEKEQSEIEEELKRIETNENCADGIVSITFTDMLMSQAILIGNRRINELIPSAFHIHVKRKFVESEESTSKLASNSESLDSLLGSFLKDAIEDEKQASRISDIAKQYWQQMEVESEENQ